ncbi:S-layer homology domain-containing protein [Cohnella zeiphila]|uniref:S-layer homology domain-containing protein n=1 Tax=Cohnella zeiphila TaxID=2761120 RepID=A0A7X0SRI4_9BACL|nr:S-layer homology domain-containing protein [Cohnella zeiphila]MBB6734833.1 S-layer homology domain-containing protein [Cohnella zeiphila]
MQKRWLTGLLAFILLFPLALPVHAEDAPNTSTGDPPTVEHQSDVSQTSDQQLPLPDENADSPDNLSAAAMVPGVIQMGSIEGFSPSEGTVNILQQGMNHSLNIVSGQVDLRPLELSADAPVRVDLVDSYVNDQGETLVYLDSVDFASGAQLLQTEEWPISGDAVRSTVNLPVSPGETDRNLYFAINGYPLKIPIHDAASVALLAEPTSQLEVVYTGTVGQTGYLLRKTATVAAGGGISFTSADLDAASEISMPEGNGLTYVQAPGFFAYFQAVDKIRVTNGAQYSFNITQTISGENGIPYLYFWNSAPLQITEDKTLSFASPKVVPTYVHASSDNINVVFTIQNGDFLLNDIQEQSGIGNSEIETLVQLKNDAGDLVYDETSQLGWCCINHAFDPKLPGGSYSLNVTVNYPGLPQPLTLDKELIFLNTDSSTNGLTIQAEDETGQRLQHARVYLFSKQPPWVDRANQGETSYGTELLYQADAKEDGSLFVPDAYLLKGRSYEMIVAGSSADGKYDAIYHNSFTGGISELQFRGGDLKHLTVSASQAHEHDKLLLSVLGDQGELSSWPRPLEFDGNHQAEVYIQGGSKLSFFTKLYDAVSDTGYFLHKDVDITNDKNQTANLNGDMIQITLPQENTAKLDVNYSWSGEADDAYTSRYLVSKGTDVDARYEVDADGYRYEFEKYLGPVDRDVALSFGHTFADRNASASVTSYRAGAVNQKVYTDYRDDLDNELNDVTMLEVAKITQRMTGEDISFSVSGETGPQTMTIQRSADGVSYAPLERADAQTSALTGGLLNYRLYDSQQLPIGQPTAAISPRSVSLDIPNQSGDYSLRLEQQAFPNDLIRLDEQRKISVTGEPIASKEVTIVYPPGYTAGSSDSYGELWEAGSSDDAVHLFIQNGKLILPDTSAIDPLKTYVLSFIVSVKPPGASSINGTLYFNRQTLSGADLLQLDKVAYPSDAISVKPEISDLPSDLTDTIVQYQFPVENRSQPFAVWKGNIKIGSTFYFDDLLMKPGDFSLDVKGTDGATTGYHILKRIHVDSFTGRTTVSSFPLHRIQLEGKKPFLGLDIVDRPEEAIYRSYYNGTMLNQAYLPEGEHTIQVETASRDNGATPWLLFWKTGAPIQINSDRSIPFTGQVDVAASSLAVSKQQQNERTVLTVTPNLISGNLKLIGVNVESKVDDGTYSSSVQAMVTITDANNNKVYEALTDWQRPFDIAARFQAETYTLTFQLPVGPNDEVVLKSTFSGASSDNNDGGTGGGSGGGGGIGGGGGVTSPGGAETGSAASKTVEFGAKDIPAAVNGVVSLDIADNETVTLPAGLWSNAEASNAIEVVTSRGKAVIPPEVFAQLTGLIGKVDLADAKVSFSMKPISGSDAAAKMEGAPGTTVKPVGDVYEMKLFITTKAGKSIALTQFVKPISLTFKMNAGADKQLTGIYYVTDEGALTYIPAHRDEGTLTAEVTHFSEYGVFEVHKEFGDVGSSHWAHAAVQELAAKQMAQGVTSDRFEPNRQVTRAEFTAMLVRALGLSSDKSPTFADVPSSAWYASAVSAAYENGLVQGVDSGSFEPAREISREEMAVIVMNASRLAQLNAAGSDPAVFKDADQISGWAQEPVRSASALGLLKGTQEGKFVPKGDATRAEAAQLIVNLLHRISE